MTEKTELQSDNQSKRPIIFILLVIAVVVTFIVRNPEAFYNIFLMLLGFGAVIFIHELGHFVAAKSVDIEVESFSIGINPIIFGIKRIQGGYQVRILPGLIPGNEDKGRLCFVIPIPKAQQGETEYRLCMIPFGGFVRMLGQEDIAADEPSDNPRAYGNKAVWQRIIVISAGVFMNIVSAAVVFMLVFAHGLKLPPAVVSYVNPDKSAALAGIKGGDEIIAINGKEDVSFMNVKIAAAFADEGEKIAFKVRHPDGSIDTYHVEPQPPQTEREKQQGVKIMGIGPPTTLVIADIKDDTEEDSKFLAQLRKIGFEPGDKIVAVNGEPITRYDQFHDVIYPRVGTKNPDTTTITVARTDNAERTTEHVIDIPMPLVPSGSEKKVWAKVMGMSPRLKINKFTEYDKYPDFCPARNAGAKKNDIILRICTISNPTYDEFTKYCKEHKNQELEIVVARVQDGELVEKTLSVTPKRPPGSLWQSLPFVKNRPIIGIDLSIPDLDNPIVAQTEKFGEEETLLGLPRGAKIISVSDTAVNNWEDIIDQLLAAKGQEAAITYQMPDSELTETITASVPDNTKWLGFAYRPDFEDIDELPIKPMTRIFKGRNWTHNLRLGADQTYSFLAQSYLFIRGAFKGEISIKAASGPVGIMKMSYNIASEKSFTFYCYFIAIISVCIAFFNFLPLPILDGGHIVMLIIEKIKGSPVSVKVQEVVSYAGLLLIGGLFLVVTFNDIVKLVTGQL